MRASELLGAEGPFASSLPGYELREAQLRMAELVEEALEHEGVALIEAGTGTGKTLAYLVPAIRSGRKVVVSTGTKTLQDQIMQHDLPLIERALGAPVRAACVKGLGNYLCRRRYNEFLTSPEALLPRNAKHVETVNAWVGETSLGDRSELSDLVEGDPIWAAIRSGSDTRIGPRCRLYESCFVTAVRREAERAQLVVVNHHLFFADLSMRQYGRGVLPRYEAIIFDEAHQVEDVATQFFGVSVSDQRVARLVQDARRAFMNVGAFDESTDRQLCAIHNRSSSLFEQLPSSSAGRIELPASIFEGADAAAYHGLDSALEALWLACEREAAEHPSLGQIARRAGRLREELSRIADGGGVDRVVWTDSGPSSQTVGASPIDVAARFRNDVIHQVPTVVLTSATLTTDRTFRFVRRRLGIDFEVDEELLDSPFDYATQAALYLPMLPDPRAPDFTNAAEDEIVRLIDLTRGGAFVLCTAMRRMEKYAASCRPRLRGRPIYVQGEAPKRALLERFRSDGDAVLFATMSFWEGVDVPGDALRLVIVDRLPFDVPTDPLIEARVRRIEEEGESAFIRYLVPSAALTLKQGFGRLIRKKTDRGIVAVLDSRLTKKGYGKVFMRSLPPAQPIHSFEELKEWNRRRA